MPDKYLRIQKYIASGDSSNFTADIPLKETLDSKIFELTANFSTALGNYVTKTSTQTISGNKIFTNPIRFDSTISLNGSTGTSGQVLTSNGSSAPTWQTISSSSDTKVTQSSTTSNGSYPVLLGYSTSTSTETNTAKKSSKLTFNPNTGVLSATKFSGNIDFSKITDVGEDGYILVSNGSGLEWTSTGPIADYYLDAHCGMEITWTPKVYESGGIEVTGFYGRCYTIGHIVFCHLWRRYRGGEHIAGGTYTYLPKPPVHILSAISMIHAQITMEDALNNPSISGICNDGVICYLWNNNTSIMLNDNESGIFEASIIYYA